MLGESFELLEVSRLRPIEGFGPRRVSLLRRKILESGIWSVPLKVEQTRHLIMDGHHRFEVAKALGLRVVPVQLFRYEHVVVYSLRKTIEVTAEIIMMNAEKGILFPYKTAKHRFPESGPDFEGIALDDLR